MPSQVAALAASASASVANASRRGHHTASNAANTNIAGDRQNQTASGIAGLRSWTARPSSLMPAARPSRHVVASGGRAERCRPQVIKAHGIARIPSFADKEMSLVCGFTLSVVQALKCARAPQRVCARATSLSRLFASSFDLVLRCRGVACPLRGAYLLGYF